MNAWKLAFWETVESGAERLWHWIYYQRVKPLRVAARIEAQVQR